MRPGLDGARALLAITGELRGRDAGQEEGLVTDVARLVRAGVHPIGAREAAAVATRERDRLMSDTLQMLADVECQRGLARAAGGEIADAHHRQPAAVGCASLVEHPGDLPVDGADRAEQRRGHPCGCLAVPPGRLVKSHAPVPRSAGSAAAPRGARQRARDGGERGAGAGAHAAELGLVGQQLAGRRWPAPRPSAPRSRRGG